MLFRSLRAEVAAADGVLFASPEYNWTVGAPLKNVLDWLSRYKEQPFQNKPIAMISATGGPVGGVRGQLDLRRIMATLGGQVLVRPEVFIGVAPSKFADGKLTDETTRKFLTEQMLAFSKLIEVTKKAYS
mgnify:CR=1 FL=1